MGRGKRCFVPRVRDNDESKSKQEKHLESSETKDKDGVMDLLEIRSIGELETFKIEISDLDSNESDSEEREEEEQKFFSTDYCKENNSKSLIFLNILGFGLLFNSSKIRFNKSTQHNWEWIIN